MVGFIFQVVKIQWSDVSMQEQAFRFVFTSFKTYYLNVIFPNFDSSTSVYSASIGMLLILITPYIAVSAVC